MRPGSGRCAAGEFNPGTGASPASGLQSAGRSGRRRQRRSDR
ncbi:MAG: hypothetical protein GKR89_15800 [Candidatus Latescibacteria bacterium]|nr:hypothetical protein [Candidatus Latescibacterota bacterium]